MVRPRTPRDLAEAQRLSRVASLAGQILVTLRSPGRGVYDSERILRGWLVEDAATFSNDDMSPALALLEAAGYIERLTAKQNTPRRGWLVNAFRPLRSPYGIGDSPSLRQSSMHCCLGMAAVTGAHETSCPSA